MPEKIIGYTLLLVGVFIIAWSAFDVYSVFTKKKKPVALFNFPAQTLNLNEITGQTSLPKTEIISAGVINETVNLISHIFIMGFVLNVGYKISSLGVTLVRPIEVKLKEKNF